MKILNTFYNNSNQILTVDNTDAIIDEPDLSHSGLRFLILNFMTFKSAFLFNTILFIKFSGRVKGW